LGGVASHLTNNKNSIFLLLIIGSPQVCVNEQHLESHAIHPFGHHATLYSVMILGGVARHLRNDEIQSFYC
jgi:hypothetical protein